MRGHTLTINTTPMDQKMRARSGVCRLALVAGMLMIAQPTPATAEPAAPTVTSASQFDLIYALHHKVIPGILFSDKGTLMFDDLFAGRTETFHTMVLSGMGSAYADGITISRDHQPAVDMVLISFPDPLVEPACFHAILVRQGSAFRYLTLESGGNTGGQGLITFLGEWTRDGKHMNYGPRAYRDMASFKNEVPALLQRP